jgi:hypothetical protein
LQFNKPASTKNETKQMKAITMRIHKFSRPGAILLATVVAIITSMVVANATQTITAPNAAFISYSLAFGANSAAITPAAGRAVLVMGCCTTVGDTGVGQVSLQRTSGSVIYWIGLESVSAGAAAITQGGSNAVGTHIVYIDYSHHVDIQMASADTIRVHNGFNNLTLAGNVTLIW